MNWNFPKMQSNYLREKHMILKTALAQLGEVLQN